MARVEYEWGAGFNGTADGDKGFCAWWSRTPGSSNFYPLRAVSTGKVCDDVMMLDYTTGIRAALNLKLSSGHGACYAGKVCSDGTVEEIPAEKGEGIEKVGNPKTQYAAGERGNRLQTPTVKKLANNEDTAEKVAWDCVWLGSYPQAEVVESAEAYTAIEKERLKAGDIIEDVELYKKLADTQDNDWDGNDIILDGERYRRIKQEDATLKDSTFYHWESGDVYHYFKYEPVKWRVLDVNGERAFLLSDIALDTQSYSIPGGDWKWENSGIRKWLNGYEMADENEKGHYKSKSFIKSAFTEEEKTAVAVTDVVNALGSDAGIEGGNDMQD